MQFLEIAGGIIGVLLSLGAFLGFAGYAVASFRKGSNDAVRENNNDLQERVQLLEDNHNENTEKIRMLETQVAILKEKITGYENLIVKALSNFFDLHPEKAIDLDKGLSEKL